MDIDFATALVWFTAFLFSTTLHEAMHALAAWRLGDATAYNGGQGVALARAARRPRADWHARPSAADVADAGVGRGMGELPV